MSVPAILIGLALLLASIPIVAGPLLSKKRFKQLDESKYSHKSQMSYDETLLALRDLDFDHQLGVVAEADYQQLRAQLLVEAAAAYEQAAPGEDDLEQLIETAIRERRQLANNNNGHHRCANCGADLDPADKYCTACGLHTESTCSECNQPIGHGDKFCKSCGSQLPIATGAVA
jgi:hypothetical protein